ncbi:hypothetical protein [Pseudomonas aeruginosa]|uniref:hypothetical protein n=1 Tax=Pseudomonas aeruginosa TaxID=287 RepID=UPI0021C8E69A|nr:hypothetical protein [Pseudomonas aeruginosa]
MTNETKTDRQRRLARERQRAKRERDALRRAALGGRRFNMDMYQGTADALDLICAAGGFASRPRWSPCSYTTLPKLLSVTRHVLPN